MQHLHSFLFSSSLKCGIGGFVAFWSVMYKFWVQAAMAAGEWQPEGSLAGLTLHWGCVQHEGKGWGPPPAGWHTIPDRSFGAGKTRCSFK